MEERVAGDIQDVRSHNTTSDIYYKPHKKITFYSLASLHDCEKLIERVWTGHGRSYNALL